MAKAKKRAPAKKRAKAPPAKQSKSTKVPAVKSGAKQAHGYGRKAGEIKRDGSIAKGSGKPEWAPTESERARVRRLARRGVPESIIATNVGVAKNTLRKHCDKELEEGRALGAANMIGVTYREGIRGSYKHAALWLANSAGVEWGTKKDIRHGITEDLASRLDRGRERLLKGGGRDA